MYNIVLPPLTKPLVAIADVDKPVIVVTTVAIAMTKTASPVRRFLRLFTGNYHFPQNKCTILFNKRWLLVSINQYNKKCLKPKACTSWF